MSRVVLELNDQALRLYGDDGLLISSPGYAVASGANTIFGQAAAEQSRLHPLSTNNEFWHRLNMEALPRPMAQHRHYAHLAYGHLMDVAAVSAYQGPVIVAVPGSYTHQQLAVLSGVLQQSPFTPEAIVDAGLLAVLSQVPGADRVVYVDLQLHQLSLTLLLQEEGQWRRDDVQTVPGAGWHSIANTLVQTISDAFVQQCRFNPQHNAVWEQQLYNELPALLRRIHAGERSVAVTIDAGEIRHEARIDKDDLSVDLEPLFTKAAQQMALLADTAPDLVLLSERAALVSGLRDALESTPVVTTGEPVTSDALAQAALQLNLKSGSGGQVPYLKRVAAQAVSPTSPSRQSIADAGTQAPTHLLLGDRAYKLPEDAVLAVDSEDAAGATKVAGANTAAKANTAARANTTVQWLTPPAPGGILKVHCSSQGVTVQPTPGVELQLNERPLTSLTHVTVGDALTIPGAGVVARFIQVITG